uniref:N6-adenine methyltransferase n=2 Tax=Calcidiscus leptoporus TaxID=127549 RepID=A0A7S0JIB4_9EUKA|mmetsp:Transcript_58557/g.134355  ORF Transcript_58557/g.134355 Transcript_58557/m.134355 type:complete len:222 (+) Transcript_58557:182-847(+)
MRFFSALIIIALLLPGRTSMQLPQRLNRKHRRHHLQPAGTPPPPPTCAATVLAPSVLAGITEDHAYEQFFFDAPTRASLLSLLSTYQRPLLLCTPSLAVAADEAGIWPYKLLDCDDRFSFLRAFQYFDLNHPSGLEDYEYDAVLCDPPFANFELSRLRFVLKVLSRSDEACSVPLYLCYNGRREEAVRKEFPQLQRLSDSPLGYESVKSSTQKHIFLYGPK